MVHFLSDVSDYELTEAEAALLKSVTQERMAEAGEYGGAVGGQAGGAISAGVFGSEAGRRGGASGGRLGGRLGALLTRPRTAEQTVEVPADPAAVRERATAAIAAKGGVVDDPNAAGDDSLWGIVGSGKGDLAPALVRVQIDATGSGGSRVHVRATGREGLIKQRIGAKAAERIVHALG
jgi:hypothetical protein